MISIIVAKTVNDVIGVDGKLPWHLPSDLKYFKEMTNGKTVIMGRGCWESIPEKYRPLPNRNNIVLTSNPDYIANGAIVSNDIRIIEKYMYTDEEVFVIGGAQIYKEAFQCATKLYITHINCFYDNNKALYLEGYNSNLWSLQSLSKEIEENDFSLMFGVYVRK